MTKVINTALLNSSFFPSYFSVPLILHGDSKASMRRFPSHSKQLDELGKPDAYSIMRKS